MTWDRAVHQENSPLHVEALSSVHLVFRLQEHYHCALASSISTGHATSEEQSRDEKVSSPAPQIEPNMA